MTTSPSVCDPGADRERLCFELMKATAGKPSRLVDDAHRRLQRLARLRRVLGVERGPHALHVGAHGGQVLLVAVTALDTLPVPFFCRLNVRHERVSK